MDSTSWNLQVRIGAPEPCVLIGGVFDPLHAGHLAYIEAARTFGPVACAVSDAPAKHPPLVPLAERARLLAMLTRGTVLHDWTIPEAIRYLKPKYYVKGKDWEGKLPADEVEACQRHGVEIIYTDTVTQSSSRLLANYVQRASAMRLVDHLRRCNEIGRSRD